MKNNVNDESFELPFICLATIFRQLGFGEVKADWLAVLNNTVGVFEHTSAPSLMTCSVEVHLLYVGGSIRVITPSAG